MKPQLVDLEDYYKIKSIEGSFKEQPPSIKMDTIKVQSTECFNIQSFINMIGLLFILSGFFFLYKRKQEKEKSRLDLELRINRLKGIIQNQG
tara:strand:- start:1207 stop:1482 length:276 start_codon:yes stop_codon:yes gene_type:complete